MLSTLALLFAVPLVSTAQEKEEQIEEVVTYGTRYPRANFVPPAPKWVPSVNAYTRRKAPE